MESIKTLSTNIHFSTAPRTLSLSATFSISRNKYHKVKDMRKCRLRVYAERDSSRIELRKKPSWYHPLEEINESEMKGGEARLTPAETTRTIIEVNSNATLMFSGIVTNEEHDSIFWPDLPYVTDEHGNIYFQVKNDEDILQRLTAEDNFVQVIIGLDTKALQSEISSPSEIDFSVDEFDDEDSDADQEDDDDDFDDDDDDGENDVWASLEDEEDLDDDDDDSLGDWAGLETMQATHPIYFAQKMAEIVSDDPIDAMNQPPAGLIILGLLKPAVIDEDSVIQTLFPKQNIDERSMYQTYRKEPENIEDLHINGKSSQDGSTLETDLESGKSLGKGTSFYKLQMINVQLISAHGQQAVVEVDKLRKTRPDAIAHSSLKIMSRLIAGGEETAHALKLLCWRCNGIKAEETTIIGIDSLGFDVRVCSGKQIETLRFTFRTRVLPNLRAPATEALFVSFSQIMGKIIDFDQKTVHHQVPYILSKF